jgi:hypothetical protein
MNYPSISGTAQPQSLPKTIGVTFGIPALILVLSASSMVHAGTTSAWDSAVSGQNVGLQIKYSETSIESRHAVSVGEPAKSGAVKKNPQPSDIKQEMDRKEKTSPGSSTGRDQGNQRKARRALA